MGLLLPGARGGAPLQSPQVPAPQAQAPAPAPPTFDVLWQAESGTSGVPRMAAGPSLIFVADATTLRAFNAADGRLAWTLELATSGPIATGQDLIAVHADEALRVLDQKTGAERWSVSIDAPATGALVTSAGVFAPAGTTLRAWGLDGQPRWERALGAAPAAPLIQVEDALIAALADGTLTAIAAGDGTPRWQHPVPSPPRQLTAGRTHVYFGAEDGAIYAYKLDGSEDFSWRFDVHAVTIGTPVLDDRCLYAALIDNSIRAFKRDIGNLCWLTPLQFRPSAGPVLLGNAVAVITATGTLVALDKRTGGPIGAPAVAPGSSPRLLASTVAADGTIYMLTVSSSTPQTVSAFRRGGASPQFQLLHRQ